MEILILERPHAIRIFGYNPIVWLAWHGFPRFRRVFPALVAAEFICAIITILGITPVSMFYLIDGYNLLHAMGVLAGKVGPDGLAKARLRLLGLLSGALGKDAPSVTIVFDAAGAPPGLLDDLEYQGIHIRFAVKFDQADDLIESLIRESSTPKQLAVVSDDRRIQSAARRRQCPVIRCLDFLEDIAKRRRRQLPMVKPDSEKKEALKKDANFWLQEFAHIDEEKEMKELFHPFDFSKETEG
jgi:predicted RNA-binding protein with PIN domain